MAAKKKTVQKGDKLLEDLKKALKNDLLAYVTLEVKKEDAKKEKLIIINDLIDKEKITKAVKPFAKQISILPLSGLWQALYDGKLSLLTTIITSEIHYDNGFIKSMKAAETLKLAVIKKFERYIMSVVLFGSLAQGKAKEESDIDLAVIVDDTDLKNMTRGEARQRLMMMINQTAREIYPKFETVQVYLLSEVWEWIKEASPVIFTIIRDGVPLFDKGLFTPWRLLLQQGKITPSPEAIHKFQESGRLLVKLVGNEINQAVSEKLYQAMLMPAQAALMLYGVMPMTYREAPIMLREIFVKEEKILEEEYPQWLEEVIQVRKDLEHGKVKQVSPEELGKQFKRAEEFQNRMDKLYEQIKKEKINDKIDEMESMINKTMLKELKNRGITAGKEPLEAFSELMRKVKNKEIDDFISNWQRILRAKKMDKLTSADVQRINRDVLNFISAVESLK
ncbi:MAG: nucleotidyltransferase domain-containing protein [Candidatus Nanoarchaeia archaeon]|jgi:uncharacterized protein (UPF0332 family)/predicted nucleotidyltransferase